MRPVWPQRHFSTLLAVIAGLLILVVIELAMLLSPGLPAAQAQVPDSGLQRKQIVDAIERTNEKLDTLNKLLRTQVLKVRVVSTDNDKQAGKSSATASESR